MKMNELGIYLHFPFCVRKCRYCDFLSAPADEAVKRQYADALIRELKVYGPAARDCTVTSVFLGGGTPSIMPVDSLEKIFEALWQNFRIAPGAEITMEMNPGTITDELLHFAVKRLTRVSLGVQSFHDDELALLGRIHTAAEAVRSVRLLQRSGIGNVNIDLISSLPGQTAASWKDNLLKAISLGVPHISAYSLILEEGTPFYDMNRAGKLNLPDEDTDRAMYHMTGTVLHGAGIERYEISNYARPGFESRHNLKYWRRVDYLGFGIGAASLFRKRRFRNTGSLPFYLEHAGHPEKIVRDTENLSRREEMEEFMFLGLRLAAGVSEHDFYQTFGKRIGDVYGGVLRRHMKEGLLEHMDGRYFLTERGLDIANYVMADYLLD